MKKNELDSILQALGDPTYIPEEIEENPAWQLAFSLSEMMNDAAPIGWSKYIFAAEGLLSRFEIKLKAK